MRLILMAALLTGCVDGHVSSSGFMADYHEYVGGATMAPLWTAVAIEGPHLVRPRHVGTTPGDFGGEWYWGHFYEEDGAHWLQMYQGLGSDKPFAPVWAVDYEHLDDAVGKLGIGVWQPRAQFRMQCDEGPRGGLTGLCEGRMKGPEESTTCYFTIAEETDHATLRCAQDVSGVRHVVQLNPTGPSCKALVMDGRENPVNCPEVMPATAPPVYELPIPEDYLCLPGSECPAHCEESDVY